MPGVVTNPDTISTADNTNVPNETFGKSGEGLVTELHGKFYTHNYRGTLFYSTNAVGTPIALPVYSATTATTCHALWNIGSKNIVPVRLTISEVTASSADTPIGFTWFNAGTTLATAAPLSAVTAVTATRGSCQSLGTAGVGASTATIVSSATITSASTVFFPLWSTGGTLAVNSQGPISLVYDFDGTFIINPGTFWMPCVQAANTGTFSVGLMWYEVPV